MLLPYLKSVVAVIGAILGILVGVLPFLPERYQSIGQAIIALATALGVYKVPNKEIPDEGPEPFFR